MISKLAPLALPLLCLVPVVAAFLPSPIPLIVMLAFTVVIIIGSLWLATILYREEQNLRQFIRTKNPDLDEKQVRKEARKTMSSSTWY